MESMAVIHTGMFVNTASSRRPSLLFYVTSSTAYYAALVLSQDSLYLWDATK